MALPAPSLALTTSVPASWIRSVRAFRVAGSNSTAGVHWLQQSLVTKLNYRGHDTTAIGSKIFKRFINSTFKICQKNFLQNNHLKKILLNISFYVKRVHLAMNSRPTLLVQYLMSGMMVTPACPPTTGQLTFSGSMFFMVPMKAFDLTTSKVVTPKTFLGSKVPAFLKISQAMGTVELTGLEMMAIMALGQTLAAAWQMVATMEALVLNRSSLVMPGLRGTPAGMTTISQSFRLASI